MLVMNSLLLSYTKTWKYVFSLNLRNPGMPECQQGSRMPGTWNPWNESGIPGDSGGFRDSGIPGFRVPPAGFRGSGRGFRDFQFMFWDVNPTSQHQHNICSSTFVCFVFNCLQFHNFDFIPSERERIIFKKG